MTDTEHDELIAELARDAVAQVAPKELPLFRATSKAYFKDPEKALAGKGGRKDQMLGFGAAEAMTFITPIALAVTGEVIKFLAGEVLKSVKAEGATRVNAAVRMMFKRFWPVEAEAAQPAAPAQTSTAAAPAVPLPPPLTPEQARQVQQLALEAARRRNLPDEQASALAESLMKSLRTAQ